jgi:hypothetical protein
MNAALPAIVLCLFCRCGLFQVKEYFNKKPDIIHVGSAIQESMIAGYAVGISTNVMKGQVYSNVISPGAPDSFPIASIISITIDANHPVPFQNAQQGVILVSGLWDSPQDGVLSIFLVNANLYSDTLCVRNIGLIPIAKEDSQTTMAVFFRQDINGATDTVITVTRSDPSLAAKTRWFGSINSFDTALAVQQEARIITIKQSTMSDPLGATYIIWGGGQFVGIVNQDVKATQYALLGIESSINACARNPVKGFALIKDVGVQKNGIFPELGTALIQFASACNGSAKVALGTGTYIGANGSSLALGLQ